MELNKFNIAIDMDGVLADLETAFSEYTHEHHPGEEEKFSTTSAFFDEFLPSYVENNGFYTQGVLGGARELVDFLMGLDVNLSILTSAGKFHYPISDVVYQKKRWIEKNFPELGLVPFTATTSGLSKSVFANRNTILIDDHENNIMEFNRRGGFGILYRPEKLSSVKKSISKIVS